MFDYPKNASSKKANLVKELSTSLYFQTRSLHVVREFTCVSIYLLVRGFVFDEMRILKTRKPKWAKMRIKMILLFSKPLFGC